MIINSDFKPAWYLKNPHLQTLVANLFRPTFPEVSYQTVQLSDGDSLQLAWGTARGPSCTLILHGLEGSLHSAYAQRLMNALNQADIPAVFMFFRGCNAKPNNKIRSYHSGETGDLREVIQHLKLQGIKNVALVGYSLGGNVTLKYMGESETDDAITSATAISVPLLLDVCAKRMDQGFSRIYQHTLLQRLKRKVLQKKSILHEAGYTTDPTTIENFVEFDNHFTAPIHGFDNANHYYQSCSSRQFLKGIIKPTLIIHARDDPFMTEAVLPDKGELSDNVTIELSKHGGHVGFIGGGWLKPEYWLDQRIVSFVSDHL